MVQNIKIYRSTTSDPISLDFGSPAVSFTGGRAKLFIGNSLNSPVEITNGSNIKNVPSGNITATNVQAAIDDLDSRLVNGSLDATTHRNLDQLVHNIADSSYDELIKENGKITSLVTWDSISKISKIREESYNYSGEKILSTTIKQYSSGLLVETLTETYNYIGSDVNSITRTLT